MARGVGNLNVSVSANTARAIKALKDFQSETRATGLSARQMKAEFQGNTIADFEKRFGGGGGGGTVARGLRDTSEGMNTFRSSVVDLTRDTNRYNGATLKQLSLTKQINQSMSALKASLKAASAGAVAFAGGFAVGQGLRGHLEYVHSLTDAWREFKSVFGLAISGYDEEMRKLEERQKRSDALAAKLDARQAAMDARKAEMQRRMAVEVRRQNVHESGEEWVTFVENQRLGGLEYAMRMREMTRENDMRDRQEAEYNARLEAEAEARKAAAQERERERERKHEAAMKKAAEARRRDQETLAELAEQARNFGKREAEIRREKTLASISDPRRRREAEKLLAATDQVERMRSIVDQNRATLAGRAAGATSPLDARSAEGWAALRDNVRNGPEQKMLKKQEEQLAVAQQQLVKLGEIASQQNQVFDPGAN